MSGTGSQRYNGNVASYCEPHYSEIYVNGQPVYSNSEVSCGSAQPVYDEPLYAPVLPPRGTSSTRGGSDSADSSGCLRPLPGVCVEFAAASGCGRHDCPRLHVCRQWLVGRCPLLRRCRLPHSLRTGHNLTVLVAGGWRQEEQREVRRWLSYRARCERLEAADLPPVCVEHARGGCRARPSDCGALHLCDRFLADVCTVKRCPLGHDLIKDDNNRAALARYGLDNASSRDILRDIKNTLEISPRLL